MNPARLVLSFIFSIALFFAGSIVAGESTLTLQEGSEGYTGCRDVHIASNDYGVNAGGAEQLAGGCHRYSS